MAALFICMGLAESDVTVMPSVMFTDWLHLWYSHVGYLVFSSTAVAFLTNMSEKCKSASPSAIQVKNWWQRIGVEEKLHIISQLKKVKELLIYAIMLDSLIVVYVQFVIMLIELTL
jgi:hypothetical protein